MSLNATPNSEAVGEKQPVAIVTVFSGELGWISVAVPIEPASDWIRFPVLKTDKEKSK